MKLLCGTMCAGSWGLQGADTGSAGWPAHVRWHRTMLVYNIAGGYKVMTLAAMARWYRTMLAYNIAERRLCMHVFTLPHAPRAHVHLWQVLSVVTRVHASGGWQWQRQRKRITRAPHHACLDCVGIIKTMRPQLHHQFPFVPEVAAVCAGLCPDHSTRIIPSPCHLPTFYWSSYYCAAVCNRGDVLFNKCKFVYLP